MNKDPKDNGKCQFFLKCCAFETIITLEFVFSEIVFTVHMKEKKKEYNHFILLCLNELLSFAIFTFFKTSGLVSQVA